MDLSVHEGFLFITGTTTEDNPVRERIALRTIHRWKLIDLNAEQRAREIAMRGPNNLLTPRRWVTEIYGVSSGTACVLEGDWVADLDRLICNVANTPEPEPAPEPNPAKKPATKRRRQEMPGPTMK